MNNNFAILRWQTAAIIGFAGLLLSFVALTQLDETFSNDLDFETK